MLACIGVLLLSLDTKCSPYLLIIWQLMLSFEGHFPDISAFSQAKLSARPLVPHVLERCWNRQSVPKTQEGGPGWEFVLQCMPA